MLNQPYHLMYLKRKSLTSNQQCLTIYIRVIATFPLFTLELEIIVVASDLIYSELESVRRPIVQVVTALKMLITTFSSVPSLLTKEKSYLKI